MKKLNYWSMMILILMVMPLIVACDGDSDTSDTSDDNTLRFTKAMLVYNNCFWDIRDITGNNTKIKKGDKAIFYADGTCEGFVSMETSYEIKDGKLYTYYTKTKEPMFVYNLLAISLGRYDTELTVRVDGTLDDKTSSTIIIRKNIIVQSAIVGKWVCAQSYNYISNGDKLNIDSDGTYTSTLNIFGTSGTYTISDNNIVFKSEEGKTITINKYNFYDDYHMLLEGTTDYGESIAYLFARL